MRSKLQNITSRLLAILMVVGLCVTNSSCTDPETTDSTKFAIFYAGITDIGPSMNFNMSGPTYIGGTPSDFSITRITLDGEVYDTDCFQISDPSTGAIKLANTDNLPVGTYCISVSCISNGNYYEFKDVITVNMLAPVPDGITVDPSEVTVDFADIYKESASAQVKTEEGTHVHISKYEIIQEEGKEYFAISNTGKITVNDKYEGEILPGKYVLNLKLTTEAAAASRFRQDRTSFLCLPAAIAPAVSWLRPPHFPPVLLPCLSAAGRKTVSINTYFAEIPPRGVMV